MQREIDTRLVARQHLKDITENISNENVEMASTLQAVNEALAALKSSTRTDDLSARDKLAALRAELADQEAKHSLEIKEVKSRQAVKMQVGCSDWRK